MLLKLIEHLKQDDWSVYSYQGIVVDNIDLKKLGRIKCKIEGLIESSSNDKLPWIFPLNSSGLGGRVDLSNFVVPEINSEVTITFPYKDIYSGFYKGYLQNTPNTHQTLFDEDYPESYGWIDSVIEWFKINKSNPSIEFFRQTLQDMIRLDENGNLWINIPKSLIINVGDNTILNIASNFDVKVGSNYSEDVGGSHGLKTGSTHGVESGGAISHQASSINHNSGIVYNTVVTGTAELTAKIAELQTKLDELKAFADSIESRRDPIKAVLKAKADSQIGN